MFYWGDYLAMAIILFVGGFIIGYSYSIFRSKE